MTHSLERSAALRSIGAVTPRLPSSTAATSADELPPRRLPGIPEQFAPIRSTMISVAVSESALAWLTGHGLSGRPFASRARVVVARHG